MLMQSEWRCLLKTLRHAGDAIMQLQRTGFAVARKDNHDLVTQADVTANHILKDALLSEFPADGWLSEECDDDKTRLHHSRVWVVDPIDGTLEFAKGTPEYAISVALVDQGEPILAAVYNPAANQLFHAIKGQGAFLGNKRLHCRVSSNEQLTVLASRSEARRGEWDAYQAIFTIKIIGSIAYKLGLIASGDADATFSLTPKNEWDIAAGVLLVQEAGGKVTDSKGKAIQFNQCDTRVNGIIAAGDKVHARILTLTR